MEKSIELWKKACLSLHFNSLFSCGPGLAGLLELRIMEVMVTARAIRHAKLETKSSPPTNQHPTFYRPDALMLLNQQCQYHIPWTCSPQAHLGFSNSGFWPLKAAGYLGEGCPASHQASDARSPAVEKGLLNKIPIVCMCVLFTASVHMPRIGHNTPGFNWYGIERLIHKHLSSRGIPTYVYPLLMTVLHCLKLQSLLCY